MVAVPPELHNFHFMVWVDLVRTAAIARPAALASASLVCVLAALALP